MSELECRSCQKLQSAGPKHQQDPANDAFILMILVGCIILQRYGRKNANGGSTTLITSELDFMAMIALILESKQ